MSPRLRLAVLLLVVLLLAWGATLIGTNARSANMEAVPLAADLPPNLPPADAPAGGGGARRLDGPPESGPPSEALRAEMEARARARISQLPAARQAPALAAFEQRKKFLDEIAALPEAERVEKMQERMERDFQSGSDEMERRMTQMDAMHTVEQRTEFFRRVLQDQRATQ